MGTASPRLAGLDDVTLRPQVRDDVGGFETSAKLLVSWHRFSGSRAIAEALHVLRQDTVHIADFLAEREVHVQPVSVSTRREPPMAKGMTYVGLALGLRPSSLRTRCELARGAGLRDEVQRRICGHITTAMTERSSSVAQAEQGDGIG